MSSYLFFWKGPFSQWFKSPFEVDGVKFNTAEQYMMYSKAMLFDDKEVADAIMRTTNPREQKALGRQVRGFDLDTWNTHARYFVTKGNIAKFTSTEELKNILLDTGDKVLVEASPEDRIWGIGYAEDVALENKADWGTNWLGLCLMEARDEIRRTNEN